MLNYILDGPNLIDLIVMIICFFSAIAGCALPRTQDIFLGVSYGKSNYLINTLREGSRVIWLLSGILLICRSAVVGIREFSFWILLKYILSVLIASIIGLICHHFSEKIWHTKHHKDVKDIAHSNPVFLKIIEIWGSGSNFNSLYILHDRAVFLESSVSKKSLICDSYKINSPVSSNQNAEHIVNGMAYKWKNDWQTAFINHNRDAVSLSFSSLEYGNASDKTIEQLLEVLAEELDLEKGTIKKSFELSYNHSVSYLAGIGETLHQKSENHQYSAATTVLAAGVLYKPEPVEPVTTHKEVQLKKW